MNESKIKTIAYSLIALSVPFFYQSCGGVITLVPDRGVQGGGITVVNSSKVYPYNSGKIDSHIEHYDDIYNVIKVDLIKPLDSQIKSISSAISVGQKFYLILASGKLNSGAVLQINDKFYMAEEYERRSRDFIKGHLQALPAFTIKDLNSLQIIFTQDSISGNKIAATRLDCVASNHPGPKGEYRNGALILQAVGSNGLSFDTITGTAAQSAKLLWEVSIFTENRTGRCL